MRPLKLRIGIPSCEVIIGGFSDEILMDYIALGATSLMVQRLKASAPENGILVSESLVESLAHAGCEDFGERMLRGGIGPRPMLQLQGVAADLLHSIGSAKICHRIAA